MGGCAPGAAWLGMKWKGVVRAWGCGFPVAVAARIVWEIVDAGGERRGPRKWETMA